MGDSDNSNQNGMGRIRLKQIYYKRFCLEKGKFYVHILRKYSFHFCIVSLKNIMKTVVLEIEISNIRVFFVLLYQNRYLHF